MPRRRSRPEPISRAREASETIHLANIADRLARLEATVEALRQVVDVQAKRVIALQAQMDHSEARRGDR